MEMRDEEQAQLLGRDGIGFPKEMSFLGSSDGGQNKRQMDRLG